MIVVDMQNGLVAPGAAMETPAARAPVPKLAEAIRGELVSTLATARPFA